MEQKKQAVKSFYENTHTYLGQDYNIRIRSEIVTAFLADYDTFVSVLDMPKSGEKN